jgi:hypothetical protein
MPKTARASINVASVVGGAVEALQQASLQQASGFVWILT